MSMTREEIVERLRSLFPDEDYPPWDAAHELRRQLEADIAERAELQAEIERLRERVRELERENRKLKGEGMDPLTYWSA